MADGSRFDEALRHDAKLVRWDAELRFAKQQQWYVATASVTLIAAAFALSKGSQLRSFEMGLTLYFIVAVAVIGATVLQDLQAHLRNVRKQQGSDSYPPTDVNWLLIIIVFVVAIAVFYCVARPMQPPISSSPARLLGLCTPLGVMQLDW